MPRRQRGEPKIPDLHFALHENTCRWGASCSWGATAVTPWNLGTLVAEHGQLSGTSGHVVMLMVMDAPGAQSALRSSVLCSRSEWRSGRNSEKHLAKSQWLKRVRREKLGLSLKAAVWCNRGQCQWMQQQLDQSITCYWPEEGGRDGGLINWVTVYWNKPNALFTPCSVWSEHL